jgi:hypothetical protein
MAVAERHVTRLTFFGRLADDLTRRPVTPADVSVQLTEGAVDALQKPDGHFAFADLAPSATDYHIRLAGAAYETRVLASPLAATAPQQVAFAGDDELYLVIVSVSAPQKRATFATIPLVPPIDAGAAVIGQGGFTATLAEPMAGQGIQSAVFDSVAGLAPGQLLRIVRGPNLLLRAGPYYPFAGGVTVVAFRVVENTADEAPVAGALVSVTELNGAAPAAVAVGALTLRSFALGGTATLVLDDLHRRATSNERGDAVLYFGGDAALTSVRVDVVRPQFQTGDVTVAVTAKSRTFTKVLLTKV